MFGSLTLTLDKSVLLAVVAVGMGLCASMILKNGLESLVNGNVRATQHYARVKGLLLTIMAIILLAASIVAILESEQLTSFLSQQIKNYKQTILQRDPL